MDIYADIYYGKQSHELFTTTFWLGNRPKSAATDLKPSLAELFSRLIYLHCLIAIEF